MDERVVLYLRETEKTVPMILLSRMTGTTSAHMIAPWQQTVPTQILRKISSLSSWSLIQDLYLRNLRVPQDLKLLHNNFTSTLISYAHFSPDFLDFSRTSALSLRGRDIFCCHFSSFSTIRKCYRRYFLTLLSAHGITLSIWTSGHWICDRKF